MTRSLLIKPQSQSQAPGVITGLTPEKAGWQWLSFEVRRLGKGQTWQYDTADNELAVVLLSGKCSVESNKGTWGEVGRRSDVFSGMPYALYLPRGTKFSLTALTEELEIASAWVPATEDYPAQLVTPEQSQIEIRGGYNATRQINSILPPGFACQKLVCVEVYTPSGNWSSYPPHKHDQHKAGPSGEVIEGGLEEIYFYKFKQPGGFAFQRVYTDDRSLDEAVVAQNNDIVLVPEGYHPVATAYGFDCYYLNFLAGSAQTLAATYDPAFDWTRDTWDWQDPRVPLVNHKMEEKVLS